MGADPMRWIYCNTRTGSDVRFGYGPAGEAKKSFNVLWNVVNYFNSNTGLKKTAKPKNLTVLDKWLLSRLESLKLKVTGDLDSFNISSATKAIENFLF